jgi:hypothetical protein
MNHKGKLPRAVVSDIMHHVNNPLGVIMAANDFGNTVDPRLANDMIRRAAIQIRDYVLSLEHKEQFKTNQFEGGDK